MRQAVVAPSRRTPETDAGYATARLRGMRSHLLERSFYERLIDAPDAQAIVKELMGTAYASDLEEGIVHGRTFQVVDDALKENMVRAYRKVLSFLDPKSRRLLSTVLGRWDVFNLKTILRGAHNHVATDEVLRGLLPAGYLSGEELGALAKLDDVRAVVDTMAMWGLPYAAALRHSYGSYAKDNDLALLELALDRQYSQWAAERLHGNDSDTEVARRILGTQVDVLNLVTAIRMIKGEVEPSRSLPFFLEGGRNIRKELFMDLAKLSDIDELIDKVRRTPYGEVLDEAALRYLERQSIPVLERALEEVLTRRALSAGIKDPHGVGVAISYLWGKQNEVTNIRIIVRGKEVGMPADRVRKELILA